MQYLINELRKIFPNAMSIKDYDGGIITTFPIDERDGRCISDLSRQGYGDEHHPLLIAFMERNNLWAEWNNNESITIYRH